MLRRPTEARLRPLLAGIGEATRMAAREAGRTAEDRAAWRWMTVGMVIALQGACVCALSAYDTAQPEDVLDPASAAKLAEWGARAADGSLGPEPAARIAPVSLLLRRVSGAEYLAGPERLTLSRARLRDALALVEARNGVVHFTPGAPPLEGTNLAGPLSAALEIVRHLLIEAPAFDPAAHPDRLAAIAANLVAIENAIREA